jgi:hypothetical protein
VRRTDDLTVMMCAWSDVRNRKDGSDWAALIDSRPSAPLSGRLVGVEIDSESQR